MTSASAIAAPAMLTPTRNALLLVCLFVIGWAVVEDVLGARLDQQYDLFQVVWLRYAVHLLIVATVWGWRDPSRIWRTRRPLFHLARSLMMLIMPASFIFALSMGSAPSFSWSVFWAAPLLLLAAAFIALRENPHPLLWVGTLIGWLGAILVLRPEWPGSMSEFIAPGLMALSFAVYVVMTRALRTEDVAANMFYTAAGVFLLLTAYVPQVWVSPTLHDAALFAGIGSFGFISLLALDRAVSQAPAVDSAPALYMQVAIVAFVGVVLGNYVLPLRTVTGLGMIGVALAIAWWCQAPARAGDERLSWVRSR